MKVDALVAEIGSTTTSVYAFDKLNGSPIFLGQGSERNDPGGCRKRLPERAPGLEEN